MAATVHDRLPPPRYGLSRRGLLAGGLALACLPRNARAEANLPPLATPASGRLHYALSWVGLPVGSHDIAVTDDGGSGSGNFTVTNKVEITISLLFFDAIRFIHTSTETWRGGLLTGFASATEDDGKFYKVTGQPSDAGFTLTGTKGSFTAPADVMTNNDVFVPPVPGHRPIVNAKTGEVVDLTVTAAGTEQVRRQTGTVRADRFDIDSDVAKGSLFYDGDLFVKGWFTRRGRTVDYKLA